MTRSKMIRLGELLAAAALAFGAAYYRAALARGGQFLIYGGYQYPHTLLAVLLAAAVAVFLLLSTAGFKAQRPAQGWPSVSYKLAASMAALGMLAAAALFYVQSIPGPGVGTYIQVAFLAVCGVTLLVAAFHGGDGPMPAMFSLFPVYYLCLFLLMFYRENSKNPVVLSFGFEIITLMALTAAVYALSGRGFGQYRPRQHLFFSLTAVFMVCFELFSALLFPDLVMTVPGISLAWLVQAGAMALYVAAGLFLPEPVKVSRRVPRREAQLPDIESIESQQWSYEHIKAQLEDDTAEDVPPPLE